MASFTKNLELSEGFETHRGERKLYHQNFFTLATAIKKKIFVRSSHFLMLEGHFSEPITHWQSEWS